MLKYHRGKSGLLFLENDSNFVWEQTAGTWKPRTSDFEQLWIFHHQRRSALCSQHGVRYLHMIVPNKEGCLLDHAQYVHDGKLVTEDNSPIKRILSSNDMPSNNEIFFRPDLLSHPSYFYRTDSHWNHLGALRYLAQALESFGFPQAGAYVRDLTHQFTPMVKNGDLGFHAKEPPEPTQGLNLEDLPIVNLFANERIVNEGHLRSYRSQSHRALDLTVLVFHDSTAQNLYGALAALFSRTLFIHCPDFDPQFARRMGAQIVIFCQAQRFTIRHSLNGISYPRFVEECEGAKVGENAAALYLQSIIEHRTLKP